MPLAAPDPDELGHALAVSELSPSAFEAHGIYCGLLTAAAPEPQQRWLAELLSNAEHDDAETAHCRSLLQDLAAATRAQLDGPSQDFDLLLPQDERSLRERAMAVHEWTRGFLFGLGLVGIDAARLSPQTREAFDDLVEVTRMDLDDLEDDESNEQALSDVVEFIRVAALLLREDLTASIKVNQASAMGRLEDQSPPDQAAGDHPR
jgi:yecA family protein